MGLEGVDGSGVLEGGNDQILGLEHPVSIDKSHVESTVYRRYDISQYRPGSPS